MSPTPAAVPSQNELVLAELQRCQGEWVAMPRLAEVSGSMNIHSRISDLRRQGHTIEPRQEGTRPRRSFYRLIVPVLDPLLL